MEALAMNTIYRCRRCYKKLLKTGKDEEICRKEAEFTMPQTPSAAKMVQHSCGCNNVEIVKP